MLLVFLSLMNYLVDCYVSWLRHLLQFPEVDLVLSKVIYAASVLAANSVLRSLFGFAFPLFTSEMFK